MLQQRGRARRCARHASVFSEDAPTIRITEDIHARIVCNPPKPTGVCRRGRGKRRRERETEERQSAVNASLSTELEYRRMMTITSGKQVVAANNDTSATFINKVLIS